jgi:hypothetical protein
MISRPLVNNGSTDAARFGREDEMAEASEEMTTTEKKLLRSIMRKEVLNQNATAARLYLLTIRSLFTLYIVTDQNNSICASERGTVPIGSAPTPASPSHPCGECCGNPSCFSW